MSNTTKPIIDAADLGPKELSAWLSKLALDADQAGQDTEMILHKLKSAEASLRYIAEDLGSRISYLASDKIIRSADHSSAVQEDLNNFRMIHVAVHGMQQTTLSLINRLLQASHTSADQDREVPFQVCAGQGLGTGSADR